MDTPRTPRRYAQWAGRPAGVPEDPALCIARVTRPRMYYDSQCSRKRGHGPYGLWCGQHGKMAPPNWQPGDD